MVIKNYDNLPKSYFSANHFIRDFIGPTSALFTAITVYLFTFQQSLNEIMVKVKDFNSFQTFVLFLVFVFVSSIVGRWANRVYYSIEDSVREITPLKTSEENYAKNCRAVDDLFGKAFFSVGSADEFGFKGVASYKEKVAYLLNYCRIYNSSGYNYVYRFYFFKSMYRQMSVYIVILWLICKDVWPNYSLAIVVFLILLPSLSNVERQTMEHENTFIIATLQYIYDLKKDISESSVESKNANRSTSHNLSKFKRSSSKI